MNASDQAVDCLTPIHIFTDGSFHSARRMGAWASVTISGDTVIRRMCESGVADSPAEAELNAVVGAISLTDIRSTIFVFTDAWIVSKLFAIVRQEVSDEWLVQGDRFIRFNPFIERFRALSQERNISINIVKSSGTKNNRWCDLRCRYEMNRPKSFGSFEEYYSQCIGSKTSRYIAIKNAIKLRNRYRKKSRSLIKPLSESEVLRLIELIRCRNKRLENQVNCR